MCYLITCFVKFDQLDQKPNKAGKHKRPDDHVGKLTFFNERKSKEKKEKREM